MSATQKEVFLVLWDPRPLHAINSSRMFVLTLTEKVFKESLFHVCVAADGVSWHFREGERRPRHGTKSKFSHQRTGLHVLATKEITVLCFCVCFCVCVFMSLRFFVLLCCVFLLVFSFCVFVFFFFLCLPYLYVCMFVFLRGSVLCFSAWVSVLQLFGAKSSFGVKLVVWCKWCKRFLVQKQNGTNNLV